MERHTGDDVLTDLRALALFLKAGGEVEWSEPEPRGAKGPDRASHRLISITVVNPARFDSYRWKLMTDPRFKSRG
jgi:hypothetical protein